ncbi:MAG: hypothetical protein WC959_02005 [Kiritimatiellales bacterium]
MKKTVTGLAAGMLLVAGLSADTWFIGTAFNSGAWSNGDPSDTNMGWVTNDVASQGQSTVDWVITHTAGTVSRGQTLTFDGGVKWVLDGGSLEARGTGNINIGSTTTTGDIVLSNGTVSAAGALQVRMNSFLRQSGGAVTAASARVEYGGQLEISGGTGAIAGTLTFANPGSQAVFSGGYWAAGDLNFGGTLGSAAGITFADGDGSLTVDAVTISAGYINFVSGSGGSLTITGYSGAADFEALWNANRIKVDGQGAANGISFASSGLRVAGDAQNTLTAAPVLKLFIIH